MATATHEGPPRALSNKAREMMEAINTEAGKHNVWVRTQANSPAQRPWFSRRRRRQRGATRHRPRRRQPDEDAAAHVALEGVQPLPATGFPRSPARPTCRRSSSPTARASCCSIPGSTAGCRSPARSAARSRSTIRATSRRCTCTRPTPAAPSCRTRAATRWWKASAARPTRGDLILTPNGTWHDHGNDDASRWSGSTCSTGR